MHQHARLANRILPAPLRLELELLHCTLSRNETKRVALLLLLVCLAVLLTNRRGQRLLMMVSGSRMIIPRLREVEDGCFFTILHS